MFNERVISNLVKSSVKSVSSLNNVPLTEDQLTEVITKSISACLLSHEFIDYVDERLGKRMKLAQREGIR